VRFLMRIRNRVKNLASCDVQIKGLRSFTSLVTRKSRKSLREIASVTFHEVKSLANLESLVNGVLFSSKLRRDPVIPRRYKAQGALRVTLDRRLVARVLLLDFQRPRS